MKTTISEQFNIDSMNLNGGSQKRNMNIFNKNTGNHPYYKKVLDDTVTEQEIEELNSLVGVAVPKDKDELRKIIEFYSQNYPKDSLNWLSVSGITDMSNLFKDTGYNGDISQWDTSNVTDMNSMFYHAYKFDQPIGKWNVGNVTNMSYMFDNAHKFNQPIGDWDVGNVTSMSCMFRCAEKFNQPIGKWDVRNVTSMSCMFRCAEKFNQNISKWKVSKVLSMYSMFDHASNFNQDISNWDINDETDMYYMFDCCPIYVEYKPKKYEY